MLSGAARGCGFFLLFAGIFSNKNLAKKIGLTEKERATFVKIMYVVSVIALFIFDGFMF